MKTLRQNARYSIRLLRKNPELHPHRRTHACAGYRREHRNLQRDLRRAAGSDALSRVPNSWSWCGREFRVATTSLRPLIFSTGSGRTKPFRTLMPGRVAASTSLLAAQPEQINGQSRQLLGCTK